MNRMIFVIVASLFLLISQLAIADTLCNSQERTLFTCKANKKTISICATQTFSESSGHLKYLYGKRGKIDLEYPRVESPASEWFKWSNISSPGVNVYLKFSVGKFRYYIYSGQGESHSDNSNPNSIYHWEYSGLAIFKEDELVRNIKCGDASLSESGLIKEIELAKVPTDDDTNFNLLSALPAP